MHKDVMELSLSPGMTGEEITPRQKIHTAVTSLLYSMYSIFYWKSSCLCYTKTWHNLQ